jgi:monofunctional biosynthetic peptidoglycan transglycosylase
VNKAPPKVAKAPRPLPGEEYETAKPLPPIENAIQELPPPTSEPLPAEPAQNTTELAPPAEQPQEPTNGV